MSNREFSCIMVVISLERVRVEVEENKDSGEKGN